MTKKNFTSEDSELFRLTIGKVQAIKSDKLLLTTAHKPKPYPKFQPPKFQPPKFQSVNVEEQLNHTVEFEAEAVGQEDSLSYTAPGLQHNVLKKLRNKHFGLDAEIDLHGLTSQEAKRQLLDFLNDNVEIGSHCVHIVHGKGYRSADNHPVLKNNLNLWLRQHQHVQAFCSASPKDGGTGAVLVLLRLSKK